MKGIGFFALLAALPACCTHAAEPPSTFENTIGSALLCRDEISPDYFNSYLIGFFGQPYKRVGGAFWYKVEQTLWTKKVREVFVSDGSSKLDFIGAIVESKPADLAAIIASSSGVSYSALNGGAFAPLVSDPGGVIVYAGDKSKIFCAKDRPRYR